MGVDLVIVAYATAGPYEQEAARLRASCTAHGLPFHLSVLPPAADWMSAVRRKPAFLQACRAQYGRQALLYVDADAVFHTDPRPWLGALRGDIGLHAWRGTHYVSGTIWLPESGRVDDVLAAWREADELTPDPRSPQNVLDRVVRDLGVEVAELPPELCWIFDMSPNEYGDREPVVEHLQASRAYRRPGRVNPRLASRDARLAEMGVSEC